MSGGNDGRDAFVDEVLEQDAEALEELARLTDVLEPSEPSSELRDRILADATHTGRFHDHAGRLAHLLDVSVDGARDMLDGIDLAANWQSSPVPGVEVYHLDGGRAVQNAITGFIRVEAGGTFPDHEHLGEEIVLVLQGRYIDGVDGHEYGPGDEIHQQPGSRHDFQVKPGPDLLYLAIVHDGMRIAGMELYPGDPRI